MRYTKKFRLRDSKKNKRLEEIINLSGLAYKHIISIHIRV